MIVWLAGAVTCARAAASAKPLVVLVLLIEVGE